MIREILSIKPNEGLFFYLGIIEGKYKKDKLQAAEFMRQVIQINPTRFAECYNYIGKFLSE